MTFQNFDGNRLLMDMAQSLGRLEAGQMANREAAEMRSQHQRYELHQVRTELKGQISEVRSDVIELRNKLDRSNKRSSFTPMAILSTAAANWQGLLLVLGLMLSFAGLISPQKFKELMGLVKG